jgi:hypothetical protein
MSLTEILATAPARSSDEVVRVMNAIDDRLPETDGLKWFNRLYLRVTVNVRQAARDATFGDPAFVTELEIVFANLYFSAIASAERDVAAAPAAWRPLLRVRHASGIARIQFALAGMNAHINRDLPEGIVQSFRALGGDPLTDRVRLQDFDRVNGLLERVENEVKSEFAVGVVGLIDQIGGPVDDALAMWKVRSARAAAWTNAKVLWALGDVPPLRDDFFGKLDSMVGLASRGLLVRSGQ